MGLVVVVPLMNVGASLDLDIIRLSPNSTDLLYASLFGLLSFLLWVFFLPRDLAFPVEGDGAATGE